MYKDYLKIIRDLAKSKKVDVFLVGGFVRDSLLGKIKNDFDFAVSKDALKFAKIFAQKIKGAYVLLDEEHACARIVKKTSNGILTFDFANYRSKTFKGDLTHRDFTINTLAVDLRKLDDSFEIKNHVIDQEGGLKDLKNRRIRMVLKTAFNEDPLRMMRAFSLRANLGFTIESNTKTLIKKQKKLIHQVSVERVREELFKILDSSQTATVLREMDTIGILGEIIPQLSVMYKCEQGGYHHLDVWKHSLEAVNQLDLLLADMSKDAEIANYLNEKISGDHSRRSLIKFALLLHDIGKPQTKEKKDDRFSFYGHECVGKGISRIVCKQLKLSKTERYMVEDMVLWHLRPGYISNFKKPSERMIFRFLRDTEDEAAATLILSLADQRATRGPLTTAHDQKHHEKICLNLIERFFKKKNEKPVVRLITGDDLIKILKLKPSVLFGKILTAVEEKQNLGKIKTKEDALALAAHMAKAHKGKI